MASCSSGCSAIDEAAARGALCGKAGLAVPAADTKVCCTCSCGCQGCQRLLVDALVRFVSALRRSGHYVRQALGFLRRCMGC